MPEPSGSFEQRCIETAFAEAFSVMLSLPVQICGPALRAIAGQAISRVQLTIAVRGERAEDSGGHESYARLCPGRTRRAREKIRANSRGVEENAITRPLSRHGFGLA